MILNCGSYFYIDLGPSGTMANFVKYNLKPDSISKTFNIIAPFDNELKNLDYIYISFFQYKLNFIGGKK